MRYEPSGELCGGVSLAAPAAGYRCAEPSGREGAGVGGREEVPPAGPRVRPCCCRTPSLGCGLWAGGSARCWERCGCPRGAGQAEAGQCSGRSCASSPPPWCSRRGYGLPAGRRASTWRTLGDLSAGFGSGLGARAGGGGDTIRSFVGVIIQLSVQLRAVHSSSS